MDEVIRRARSVMQMEGTDILSGLDEAAVELGLGSIFDENSKAGEMAKKHLVCNCAECASKK